MHEWIGKDLRATLRMGNVLTGGLYVDLQHDINASPLSVKTISDIEVIPTVSNEFTQLTQKADAILDKLNNLPLETMIVEVTNVIDDIKAASNRVEQASSDFDTLMGDIDAKALNKNLNEMLINVSALLENYTEGGLSKGEIQETVDTMQETLRNIQPLLLQLNQKPNGLIFSDNSEEDIQPKAGKGMFNEN